MTRTTPDLAEWLSRHDLGQYAQAFAENNIEYSLLPDLTEHDLKKLGVSSLGHRKKLLRAIEALTRQPAGTPAAASAQDNITHLADQPSAPAGPGLLTGPAAAKAKP